MTIGKGFLYSIIPLFFFVLLKSHQEGLAAQCGKDARGVVCAGGLCCSQYGYCGSDSTFCGQGCQSQCKSTPTPTTPTTPTPSQGGGVSSIVTNSVYDRFFDHHSDGGCPSNNFYTYDAFIQATKNWPTFGNYGDADSKKRELAAFFANAAHETTGGCYKEEISKSNPYCSASAQWPCAAGKKYYGRGPLQITWNYNYGQAGKSLEFDGINDPDIVARDATTSFKTALWFWMTPQSPKSSCHDAISKGQGFGETIKIINGGLECGSSGNPSQQSRVKYFTSFCQILGVDPGNNLTC